MFAMLKQTVCNSFLVNPINSACLLNAFLLLFQIFSLQGSLECSDSDSVLDLLSGSRSSTPGLLSRKSPTMDAGVQCSQPKDDKKHPQNRAVQPPNRGDGRSSQNRDRRGDHEQRPQFRNYRDPQQQHRDQNNDYHDRNQVSVHISCVKLGAFCQIYNVFFSFFRETSTSKTVVVG